MKKNTETIVDDNGIEMLVGYEYDVSLSFQAEYGNPSTHVDTMIYTELKSVELVVCKSGIELLPFMSEKQKDFIISKLTYEQN